jgi:hypothetical protein
MSIRRPGGVQPATLLTKEPVSQLPSGYYVAPSDSRAYTGMRAAVEAGHARLVGERYTDTGTGLVKLLTVEVRSGRRAAANPSIGIGREFFASALKDYRDWEIKWWREVVQNAVDAGATEIALDAKQSDDGTWIVSCTDNGGGMTEDVLINKFLVLGGTTKAGAAPGVAGGFGKAKELILLPWIWWETHTRGVVVRGAGAEYEIKRGARNLRGTKLTVCMPPDQYTASHQAIAFVEKCFLPGIRFRVNGKVYRGKLTSDKLIDRVPGKVDVFHVDKKDASSSGMLVRTNGLYMFSIGYQSVQGYLVAEITAPSIEILTANRDGFRDGGVRHAIDNLGTKIAKDVKSALRAKKGMIRQKFRGSGKFQAAKEREVEALASINSLIPTSSGRLDSMSMESVLEVIDTMTRVEPVVAVDDLADEPARPQRVPFDEGVFNEVERKLLVDAMVDSGYPRERVEERGIHDPGHWPDLMEVEEVAEEHVGRRAVVEIQKRAHTAARKAAVVQAETVHSVAAPQRGPSSAILQSVDLTGITHAETLVKQLVWEPDFYIHNDVEGWRPQKRFYPESMTPKLNKLARVWTELCRYVLIQLNCDLPFGVGWIFDTGASAAYQGEDPDENWSFRRDKEHWLLLNPFLSTDPRKAGFYSPTKAKDLKVLYALAIHEATHMADGIVYHDESFASALTHNMARCADGFKHARKIARSVKMKGRARADR